MKHGYRWYIRMPFGEYEPVDETYTSLTALHEEVEEAYPEYKDYYGVYEVEDNDGFITFLKEIQQAPPGIYHED